MPSKPLRIGIDARAAAEVPAGRGRYVRELVRALLSLDARIELVLYARVPWTLPGTSWRLLATPDPAWPAHAGVLARRECDVVLATNSFLMAAVAGSKSVAMVHDLFGVDRRFGAPAGALGERATLPLAARRGARFVCSTRATRDELVTRFPELAGRSAVVPLGVDARFAGAVASDVPRRYGLERGYVLAVGTVEPRKNLPRLVRAFLGLPRGVRSGHRLAIAGAAGWSDTETEQLAARHGDVVRLGFVPDDDLAALYAGAAAFAFPSLGEGFGLPVLEAMAAGTAVVTSNGSALGEVAGDAAKLVDPWSVESIRDGLIDVLTDDRLRSELAARGRARAAEYTWERTARETLAYLTSVTSTFDAGKSRDRKVSS
jgi:glycosyltransferase involved in cell wall biosynthesis